MGLATLNRMLTLTGRLFDRKQSTIPLVHPTSAKPAYPGCAGVALPCATPEEMGLSSRELAAFFKALKDEKTLDMHSVTVLRHGRVVARAAFGDWDPDVWKTTFSACKSVVALAIGCLVDDGRLHVHDRVLDFFPEEANVLVRLRWRELTVEDLLTMRSEAAFNEFASASETDWVKCFFNAAPLGAIGGEFRYNSLNTYILAALIVKITGQTVSGFLRARLFDPLGIGEVYWETCPQGVEKGGWGLYILPDDLAKLGQLVMQRGVWKGQRLLSEEWIETATAPHAVTKHTYGDYNYGYHIWTARSGNRFLFNGMLGQNVLGFWDNGVVVVSHAGNNELFQQSRYFPLVHDLFDRPFANTLPPDPEGVQLLQETLATLKTAYPLPPRASWWQRIRNVSVPVLPALCYQLHHTVYTVCKEQEAASVGVLPVSLQAVTSRYTNGLQAISFETKGDTFAVCISEGGQTYRLPVGFFAPQRVTLTFEQDAYWVSVRGRISTDEEDRPVILLYLSFLETPYTRFLKMTVLDEELLLELSESPGEGFIRLLTEEIKTQLEKQPLVGGAIQKVDMEYVDYKVDRLFRPRVSLQKES